MSRRTKPVIPFLALSLTLAMAASLQAQVSGSLQINLGTAPHWTEVTGTHVQIIPQAERPSYDMFRYGNDYYVYDNDRWYRSNQWRGSFTAIDAGSVPQEFSRVPREHWRRYPSQWQDRSNPGNQISISYFYDNLASEGEWFHDANYGWSWTPYDLSANWRPYSDGHWEYTDYGWSWASNEPWGWATYHYGRWFFDDSYGWAWVPGTEWAPAWVAWRYGDDWVGWAPLPPTANWDASSGLAFADPNVIQPAQWCFVPRTHMLDVSIGIQLTSIGRNVTLLERSRDATRFEVRDGRPANIGIDVAVIEKQAGRQVPREKIVDVDSPDRGGGRPVSGGLGFYRPKVEPMPVGQAPAPAVAQRRVEIPQSDLQRMRDEQGRKLESDLNAEHSRLASEQAAELRGQAAGAAVEQARTRQAAEQQAFEAHATQQRRVFAQRMDKQVVNPGKVKNSGKPENPGNGKDKSKDNGKGNGGK